jgi:hypothetical protein
MTSLNFTRRLTKRTYRLVRVLVRLISILILLALALFVFLRIYGVPDPLVRKIIQRVNQAGVALDADGIFLTFKGWRADDFRYYSNNPDDLKPVLEIRQVFFSIRDISPNTEGPASGWGIKLLAVDVNLAPPKEWRVDIEENSAFRHVDKIGVNVNLQPGLITLSDGNADWLGVQFSVNGSFIMAPESKPAVEVDSDTSAVPEEATVSPLFTREQFRKWEDVFNRVSLTRGANADITFSIDAGDYSATWIDLDVTAEEIKFQDLDFSKGEVLLSYAYPTLTLDRVRLFKDAETIQISSEYNVSSKELKSTVVNSITDKELLLLFPAGVRDYLEAFGLNLENLPGFNVNLGPAIGVGLLNRVAGEFAIRNARYKDLTFGELRGNLKRVDDRLELTEVKGVLLDHTEPSAGNSSAMRGGAFEGEVFWGGEEREFRLKADTQFDPNLLVGALSRVRIATNVIQRFSFMDHPPVLHLDMGSSIDNWSTFRIDARLTAKDAVFQGVNLSSLNVTTTYESGKLNVAPVVAMQGVDYTRGSARVDFYDDTVVFDIQSSMSFADLENAVYPASRLFETTLMSAGEQQLTTSGIVDWGGRGLTDFKASVESEQFELPVATMDQVRADITGKGSFISVRNIDFGLYGGQGSGEFSIHLGSKTDGIPYRLDFEFSDVDFDQLLEKISTNTTVKTLGEFSGNIHCTADLSTNFLASAKGTGAIVIENGQLKDLPLFKGFSRVVRKIFPSFTVFSITSLKGNYTLHNGVITSDKIYFGGSVLSASAMGSYSTDEGFDAFIHAQILNESRVSRVVRLVTDPLMKFLQFKLEGPMSDPSWKLQKLPRRFLPGRKSRKESTP